MTPPTPTSPRRYLIVMAALAVLTAGLGCLAMWLYNVLPCAANGYGPGRYMSYCDANEFGDYEHGALYFGLEPKTIEAARAADVILIGNSRAEVAFSTKASDDYFSARGLKFYTLGFGYDESNVFPEALLDRLDLHPKMLIVNADPSFFTGVPTTPTKSVLSGSPTVRARYALIRIFEKIHGPLCARFPWLCRPWARQRAIYRSDGDGYWRWQGSYFDANDAYTPVNPVKHSPISDDYFPYQVVRAQRLLESRHIDRRCVVLTGVPNSFSPAEDWAERMARELHVAAIIPRLDGLMTIDDSHMNQPSAERWSSNFLTGFDPLLTGCLARN